MRPPRFFRFAPLAPVAFAAVTAAGATGCASKPTMHLNHAELSGMQLGFPPSLNVVLTCVVDVYNPNSYDVAVRAVRGQVLMAAGRYTFPLDFRPGGDGVWLSSKSTTQVRVPVTIPVPTAIAIVRDAYLGPSIDYQMIGTADVTATRTFQLEKDDYSVSEHGMITRDQIAATLVGIRY